MDFVPRDLEKYLNDEFISKNFSDSEKSTEQSILVGLGKNSFSQIDIKENISKTDNPKIKELWVSLQLELKPLKRLRICHKILDADKTNIDVQRMIMDCYLDLDQVNEAKEFLDEFERIHGNIYQVLFSKADYLRHIGKFEDSIPLYKEALLKSPDNDKILNNLALTYSHLELYDEAIQSYEKQIELDENDFIALYNYGSLLYDKKSYNDAIIRYDKVISIIPEYAKAWNGKGKALEKLGNYQEAIKCYDKAIEYDNKYDLAYKNKGNTLSKLNQYEEAIKCYDKAIEIDPKYKLAYKNKGNTLSELKKYEEAIKCYDKAIEIDPKYKWAYKNKGNALSKLKKYEEAIKCFDKAIELAPNDSNLYNNASWTLSLNKKFLLAKPYVEKALALDDSKGFIWHTLGYIHMNLGDDDKALHVFNHALSLNQNQPYSLRDKGKILFKMGLIEEARELIKKSKEIKPDDDELNEFIKNTKII